jgi:NADPH:quinone reductase-like Zn-dependent oxidoreductase
MQVVAFNKTGPIDVLSLQEAPMPVPAEQSVLVKIESVGLNRADSLYREGRYFIKPFGDAGDAGEAQNVPSRVGFEGAGTVVEAPANSDFSRGDKVGITPLQFDVKEQGCLAQYGVYPASCLVRTPAGIDADIAGGIWMPYLTAWGGLVTDGGLDANTAAGKVVVITAASSSVGTAAIQLAVKLGATVIATTTSDQKMAELSRYGAHHVINMKTDDYVARIREITSGGGTDLVFDAVAGPGMRYLVQGAARGSKIIVQGMLDRRPMEIHAGVLMKRLLTLKGFTLDMLLENTVEFQKAVAGLTAMFEKQEILPVIAQKFPMAHFAEAFALLESNKHTGKIIINPWGSK